MQHTHHLGLLGMGQIPMLDHQTALASKPHLICQALKLRDGRCFRVLVSWRKWRETQRSTAVDLQNAEKNLPIVVYLLEVTRRMLE